LTDGSGNVNVNVYGSGGDGGGVAGDVAAFADCADAHDVWEWDEWTRGSAIRRAGYGGLKRNVAVALGNWGAEEAVPVLVAALGDAEPLVRGHAAWALGEIGSAEAVSALAVLQPLERDPLVRDELEVALERSGPERLS
jgi:HEAT repeat protein